MDIARLLQDSETACGAARIRIDPETDFPIWVAKVKLTWRCNLRCDFCALWRVENEPEPLTVEMIDRFLTRLKQKGLRKVHFSGGEPFLRKDFGEILERTGKLDLQINLTTNGTLIDKDAARLLVDRRVHTVAFSIDGASEKKHDESRGVSGAWRKTWKGIARLKERRDKKGRGPVIAVNTVVTRKNIEKLSELHQVLSERGVDTWRLLPVRTFDKKLRPKAEQWAQLKDQWQSWLPLLTRELTAWLSAREAKHAAKGKFSGGAFEKHICYAPWFSIFLDADGRVFSCCTGRRTMPNYGNAHQLPLEDILSGRIRREVLAGMAGGHEFEVCRTCDEFRTENEAFASASRGCEV